MKHCHLFSQQSMGPDDLNVLVDVEKLFQTEHRERAVKKCTICGNLFLYEYFEYVNYEGGDDVVYETYAQVETTEHARELCDSGILINSLRPAIYIRGKELAIAMK